MNGIEAALAILLSTSAARRRFPGKGAQLTGAGLTGASVVSLVAMGSGVGWIALVAGLILNAVLWASIRSHKCPRDGSWMEIDEQLLEDDQEVEIDVLQLHRRRLTFLRSI